MNYLILAFILLVVPFLCGLIPLRLMNESHRSILGNYVYGWFVMFSLFQVTAVPFILLKKSFSQLVVVYCVLICIVMLLSIMIGRKALISCIVNNHGEKNKLTGWEKGAWIFIVILILAQMVFLMFHQYIDGDDAYYLTVAVDTLDQDTMYLTNAYDGYPYTSVEIRHALSPVPIFMALISRLTAIHPTILAHTFIGPAFIGLMYAVYCLVGRRLLREHKRFTVLFMLFLIVFYIFGHVSLYTAETFAYTRTWQGKSMLPNLVIPCIYLALLQILDDDSGFGEWLLLFMATLAAVFTTSVSVFFVAVLLMISLFYFLLRRRRQTDVTGFIVCITPCIVFGILYIIQ